MTDDIDTALRKILKRNLNLSEGQMLTLTEATTLEDLDGDSLELVEVSMDAESEFGIELPDVDVENVETYGQLLKIVRRKIAQKG